MTPHPRLLVRFILVALLALLVVSFMAGRAKAHTTEELEVWMRAWEGRNLLALDLSDEMKGVLSVWPADEVDEIWGLFLFDMQERHPCSKVMSTWEDSCVRVTTTTHPPRTAVNRDMGSNVEQWRPLVEKYFASDKVATAMCIMKYESGGNPNAKNRRSTAAGLFQFLKSTWDKVVPREVTGGSYASGQVYIPEANVRAAAWLQANAGWTQWSVYKRCR